MAIQDAALNLITLGYSSYRKRLQLEGELKSLRDAAAAGGQYSSAQGNIGVYQTHRQDLYPRKQNVRLWRNYSQYNVWVRACIDKYRSALSQADWQLVPIDEEKPMDKGVVREIEQLIAKPNSMGKPYSQIKEEMIEDWLTVGHGVLLKKLQRNLAPYELNVFDASRFAFNDTWYGDQEIPRYALYSPDFSQIEKYIPDPAAMVLINTSTSYDVLGLSHVEKLDQTVRALIAADDYLREQVLNPSPSGLINLGRGINQSQVDETRQQMNAVKKPIVIIGGVEGIDYKSFTADQAQQQVLASSEWFVRQCCAVFDLPTAAIGLSVDTSRANTEAMLAMQDTGLNYLLRRMESLENMEIVSKFGDPAQHNVKLAYPILNQKDETVQADISQKALSNIGWKTINEVRKSFGDEPLPFDVADEVLVPVSGGAPVPLSRIQEQYVMNRQQESAPAKSFRKMA